ncbi:kinetochore protein NUF2 homolog [Medicago truncatula]|uniref:kinetochore protein NUF2 homolog n=1 Tax=Medicago truncatula TaxID=3880 RepID=UPI000D2F3693|nr:kinetochore protein NUF2 homolog [Medicago truncatula]
MSNYEYPRLGRSEIILTLSQFEIETVADHQISNPRPNFILHLYNRILNHLDFLLDEDNHQLDFNAVEHLENPDLHVGSVPVIKVYNKIKEMLNTLECPKKYTFNLADLVKPDPHRTEFFLGALLNFCLDRAGRMNSIEKYVDEFNALEQKIVEIKENKITQLKLAIAESFEAREREMPFVQEVDAKVKELRQTIPNLNNKQMSLTTNLKKLKEENVEMDEKISDAEYRLIQNVQENANLRSKIAQSPDKVHRALEEKKLARDVARNSERLAMHNFHEKTALVEVFSKVYKKMSKHNKQVQAMQEQANSAKSIEKDHRALKAKVDAANSRITSEKESATAKLDQLDSKGTELVEEFHKDANSFARVIESWRKSSTIKRARFDNLDSV